MSFFTHDDPNDPNKPDDLLAPRVRGKYWRKLRIVRDEFLRDFPEYFNEMNDRGLTAFRAYIADKYGIQVIMDGRNISPDHKIIDEAKYLFFLLKHE
jgi:hypothetical protein